MKKSKNSAFIIATQYDNLGDLIINKCLIDEISKHTTLHIDTKKVSDEFINYFSKNKNIELLNKTHNFSFKNISVLKYLLFKHNSFKFIFKSPGPIFYRNQMPLKSKISSMVFNIIFERLLASNGKTYVIGSEVTIESPELVKKFLTKTKYFDKFLLRSKSNVEYLKSIGVQNSEYIPDLCFLLRSSVNFTKPKNKIGISFRDLKDHTLNANIEKSVEAIITYYTLKDYEIMFFYQVDRDFDYNKKLYTKYEKVNRVSFIEKPLTFNQINTYEDFKIVLSNRLHVLLLGYIHNSITIPIINDDLTTSKIHGIYNSINSSIKPFNSIDSNDINEIENNYDKLISEINRNSDEQLQICSKKIKQIFN